VTPLVAPPVHHDIVELPEHKPEPLRIKPAPTVTPVEPVVMRTEVEKPKEIKLPEVRFEPKPVPIDPAAPKLEVLAPPAPAPAPAAIVKTDVFADPAAAKSTADAAPRKVLSTGFGEGDATGTARASRGVVMGSGFSDSGVDAGSSGRKKSVQSIASGFDDVRSAEPQAKRRETEIVRLPVEIVFKPRPDYTEEARRLRVQGDVVLRVLFAASGKVQVLDVVQGLGYGLDQNARRAAEQIRFKPASSDGKAVDSTANVRIAFQLAY
jgi:TonB family protein